MRDEMVAWGKLERKGVGLRFTQRSVWSARTKSEFTTCDLVI
jgi:hypothetical protein